MTGQPVKFIGTGERPDAFEPFHPDRIVSRIMGMGDVATLLAGRDVVFCKQCARILYVEDDPSHAGRSVSDEALAGDGGD